MNIPEDIQIYLNTLTRTLQTFYNERLVSIAVFGSLARGEFDKNRSDIDLLVVLKDPLPSHFKRNKEFLDAEGELADTPMSHKLSPVIRTVKEIEKGTPLMLDMTEELIILFDKNNTLSNAIKRLKNKLNKLNAKRVFRGSKWYWILKPDIKWGEVFEI